MPISKKSKSTKAAATKASAAAAVAPAPAIVAPAPVDTTTTTTIVDGVATTTTTTPVKKTRRTKRNTSGVESYLFKIHRQCNGKKKATEKSLSALSSILMENFNTVSEIAVEIAMRNGKRTVRPNDIDAAVRIQLSGELSKYAVAAMAASRDNYTKAVAARVAAKALVVSSAAAAAAPVSVAAEQSSA